MSNKNHHPPVNATKENIGQIVNVQVFERSGINSDTIRPSSQQSFAGRLQSYQSFEGGFAFKIEGMPRQTFLYSTHLVEIYEA